MSHTTMMRVEYVKKSPSTGTFAVTERGFIDKSDENVVGEVTFDGDSYVIRTTLQMNEAMLFKIKRCFGLMEQKVRVE